MRTLSSKQKKLLREWFNKNYDGGSKYDMASKIDNDTYTEIENLHPTEIHFQNVNHYLEQLVEQKEKNF